jgi:hypothetical protein
MRPYIDGNVLWFRAVRALGWANLCVLLLLPADWFGDGARHTPWGVVLDVFLLILALVAFLAPLPVIAGMAMYSRRLPGTWNLTVAAAVFLGPVVTAFCGELVASLWGIGAFESSLYAWATLACGASGCALASLLCRRGRGEVGQRCYPLWCVYLCGVAGLLAGGALLINGRLMWEGYGLAIVVAYAQVLAMSTAACFGVVALATWRGSGATSAAET